jgi:hypothetical protein
VNLLGDLGEKSVARVAADIATWSRPGDLVMVSLHWGPNWGWEIPRQHRAFAHALIEEGRRRRHPWAFVAPPDGGGSASRPADPLRLRRPDQ